MTAPSTEPTELTTALVAGLAIQANQLTDAAKELRETYRFSRTLRILVGIGFCLLVALTVIALQNRANGSAARDSSDAAQRSIAAIKDCTTPGGICYERGQAGTGEAVAQIVAAVNAHTNLVFIATLQCSKPHQTNAELAACLRAKGIR